MLKYNASGSQAPSHPDYGTLVKSHDYHLGRTGQLRDCAFEAQWCESSNRISDMIARHCGREGYTADTLDSARSEGA